MSGIQKLYKNGIPADSTQWGVLGFMYSGTQYSSPLGANNCYEGMNVAEAFPRGPTYASAGRSQLFQTYACYYPSICDDGGCTPGYIREGTGPCVREAQLDECGCCLSSSPIALRLAPGRPNFSGTENGVVFDITGTGRLFLMGWPLTTDDAWLVLDRNDNGQVDNGSELFGNWTPLASGTVAKNGYQALAELDANRDNLVDESDPDFSLLLLWVDRDRNGRSSSSECMSLSRTGITALSVDYRESGQRDREGNFFRLRAKVYSNFAPLDRFSYDVYPVAVPVVP